MVFYAHKHYLQVVLPPRVPVMPVPAPLPYAAAAPITRQSSDEGSTFSVDNHVKECHATDYPCKMEEFSVPPKRRVSFNQITRIYQDANEYVEPSHLWYSRTEIRTFLGESQSAAAIAECPRASSSSSSSSKTLSNTHRRLQRAYWLYGNGLDALVGTGVEANDDNHKAEKAVGLDRLVIHAHLRSRHNVQRRRLLRRLMDLQSVTDCDRRERLQAQASAAVSEPARLAAAHLAQWWASNQKHML